MRRQITLFALVAVLCGGLRGAEPVYFGVSGPLTGRTRSTGRNGRRDSIWRWNRLIRMAVCVGGHCNIFFKIANRTRGNLLRWRRSSSTIRVLPAIELGDFSSAASMAASPRGGIPASTATRDGDGWRIDGHKIFATGAPALSAITW
jgi:hypothetical protein